MTTHCTLCPMTVVAHTIPSAQLVVPIIAKNASRWCSGKKAVLKNGTSECL